MPGARTLARAVEDVPPDHVAPGTVQPRAVRRAAAVAAGRGGGGAGPRGLLARAPRPPVLERVPLPSGAPRAGLFVYHEPRLLARPRPTRLLGAQAGRLTSRLRLAHVRRLARRLGMRAPLLWIFDPTQADAIGMFRAKLVIYHVLDNYLEFFDPSAVSARAAMATGERRMLAQADVVFTVSEPLRARCAEVNRHACLVPNGVDYDRFQAAIARGDVPAGMRSVPRPILGYVGAIQPTIDFALLERLADARPAWSLALVGPEELGADRPRLNALAARPNVFVLGCQPVEDVPRYIHACDVCLMPDRADGPTVADSDSIKLYEYLACGRPVVCTDTPAARRFAPLVRVARDPAEFIALARESLAEPPEWAARRKAAAREHSWQRRVEVVSDVVRRRLAARVSHQGQREARDVTVA
jgi:glycosyltransferase involved in cell wall biosynthesis